MPKSITRSASRKKQSALMRRLLRVRKELQIQVAKPIKEGKPILSQLDQPLLYPNTIGYIQGQAGTHKSRLAEAICTQFVKNSDCNASHVGFEKEGRRDTHVLYVDTERNIKSQFPGAMQRIIRGSCMDITDAPERLDYISLLAIKRNERLRALQEYIAWKRQDTKGHVLIVLDVVSDCISDFNDAPESMGIIDYMNTMINEEDVTFLCVIHENPNGNAKARGHLGTELKNKASITLQISQYGGEMDGHIVYKIQNLKNRMDRPLPDVFVEFDESTGLLVLCESSAVSLAKRSGYSKAPIELVSTRLPDELKKDPAVGVVHKSLAEIFSCDERTIRERLKEMIEDGTSIDTQGKTHSLERSGVGKGSTYRLI